MGSDSRVSLPTAPPSCRWTAGGGPSPAGGPATCPGPSREFEVGISSPPPLSGLPPSPPSASHFKFRSHQPIFFFLPSSLLRALAAAIDRQKRVAAPFAPLARFFTSRVSLCSLIFRRAHVISINHDSSGIVLARPSQRPFSDHNFTLSLSAQAHISRVSSPYSTSTLRGIIAHITAG